MQISITSKGSVVKLNKTDRNRLSEIIAMCDALRDHRHFNKIAVHAESAWESLRMLVLTIDAVELQRKAKKESAAQDEQVPAKAS